MKPIELQQEVVNLNNGFEPVPAKAHNEVSPLAQSESDESRLHQSLSAGQSTVTQPTILEITDSAGRTLVRDIRQDLAEFTGLSLEEVRRLLARHGYNARDEFKDCVERENSDHWFYLGSRYFLFENATHGREIEHSLRQLLPDKARVWEFGGGTGNISLTLAANGYQVAYTELNSLQRDFVEFRAHKYRLNIETIAHWQDKPRDVFDLVLAIDVLEHIPDYTRVLSELCQSVKKGGLIWETSAFEKNPKNLTHRIPDGNDYKRILTEFGFVHVYAVQAGKLWKKLEEPPARHDAGAANSRLAVLDNAVNQIDGDNEAAQLLKRHITRAADELKAGNHVLAMDYLDEAYALNPDFTRSYCTRVVAPLMKEKLQKLELTAREALEKEPDNTHSVAGLFANYAKALEQMRAGLAGLKAEDPRGALRHFDEAVTACPTLPNLQFARATALIRLGNLPSARHACLAEISVHPGHEPSARLLERIESWIA